MCIERGHDGTTARVMYGLSWEACERILGHPHAGRSDDKRLIAHLIGAGAPESIRDHEAIWIDENAWYVWGDEWPSDNEVAEMLESECRRRKERRYATA